MLHFPSRMALLTLVLFVMMMIGCAPKVIDPGLDLSGYHLVEDYSEYGHGGAWDFKLPFPSGDYYLLTQGYGSNEDSYTGSHHNYGFEYGDDTYALDFAQNGCDIYGDAVTPIMDGTVLRVASEGSRYDQGYGNNVLVSHADGLVSRYAHLSEIYVNEGEELSDTDRIGAVGNTGYCLGTACQDHPGAHLHIAVYQNGNAVPPLPLSGMEMSRGCWYNREGAEECGDYPGTYTETDDYPDDDYITDDEDFDHEALNINYVGASPGHGIAGETEFLWLAVVESSSEPDVTLIIYNPNDGSDYDFTMDPMNNSSPYVFVYRKTLRDPIEYEYRVRAESNGDSDTAYGDEIEVDSDSYGNVPEFHSVSISPSSGEAGETEFHWRTAVDSRYEPEVTLNIVNVQDAMVYQFDMDVYENDDVWMAEYEKTLRDSATYVFWMEAEVDELTNVSDVLTVEVE